MVELSIENIDVTNVGNACDANCIDVSNSKIVDVNNIKTEPKIILVIGAEGSGKSEFLKAFNKEIVSEYTKYANSIIFINENEYDKTQEYNAKYIFIDTQEIYGDTLVTNDEVKNYTDNLKNTFPDVFGSIVCINAKVKDKMRLKDIGLFEDPIFNLYQIKNIIITSDTLGLEDCNKFVECHVKKFPVLSCNTIKSTDSFNIELLLNLITLESHTDIENALNCYQDKKEIPSQLKKLIKIMDTEQLYTKGYIKHIYRDEIFLFNVSLCFIFVMLQTLLLNLYFKNFTNIEVTFWTMHVCFAPSFVFVLIILILGGSRLLIMFDYELEHSRKKKILEKTIERSMFELYRFPKFTLPKKKYRIKDTIYYTNGPKAFEGYFWGNKIESGTFYDYDGSVLYVLK